ncbi:helix-turn-helix transcriptional regulator [Acinetobacter haemolyticus]|uniref:helix-turn-helix domain-containing protein n=1 Tax=Acinetobacter haemolyticus TaxID=29430 RepID=UPI003009E358
MSKVNLLSCQHVDISIVKMEQIASHLVGLLRHSNTSRAELATRLGWKKSRVTKVLSGDENLTIKTISAITQQLGYDFDIVFHNKNYEKPKQPWQIDRTLYLSSQLTINKNNYIPNVSLELQTGDQVVEAVLAGKEKDYYVSVNQFTQLAHDDAVPVMSQLDHHTPVINITYLKENTKVVRYE